MDSFAYAITDLDGLVQVIRIYQPEADSLDSILQSDDALNAPYAKVNIGIAEKAPVLVPAKLYNPLEKLAYLRHLSPLPIENADIQSEELADIGCFALYALPEWAKNLRRFFPGARIMHLATALIKNCRHWPAPATPLDPRLIVHVGTSDVLVLLFSADRLVLCNTYPYSAAEDFLYYLLLAIAQEGFDNNQTPVYLSGSIVEDSTVYRIIQRFFKKTNFIQIPEDWPKGAKTLQSPAHFFFALLCLRQC